MRSSTVAALALLLGALSGAACRDKVVRERSSDSAANLSEIDLDGDGRMSLTEFREGSAGNLYHYALVFRILDFDRDGLVTPEEFAKGALESGLAPAPRGSNEGEKDPAAPRGALTARHDADGDGLLTREELELGKGDPTAARVLRYFDRIDADGDGMLAPAELRANRKKFGVSGVPGRLERGRDKP